MAAHLKELAAVSDAEHHVSFYSMGTTLEGIKAVAGLANSDSLENLTVHDILSLLNIVGRACEAPVSGFPDPMTWRVNRIHPGCFISVADLFTVKAMPGSDGCLTVPGHLECEITSAIPVFEHAHIASFLRKRAPCPLVHLFSRNAQHNRRREYDRCYTMCAGIWKLVETLASAPTELNLSSFDHLCKTCTLFIGNYFAGLPEPLEKPNSQPETSYYIAGNGVINLIGPIYRNMAKKDRPSPMPAHLPSIVRALFSHEIWQAIRREFKGEGSDEFVQKMLYQLLGIDLDAHCVQLTPFFEEDQPLSPSMLNDQPLFNWQYLEELMRTKAWYVSTLLSSRCSLLLLPRIVLRI
jgi:hypothetical protein